MSKCEIKMLTCKITMSTGKKMLLIWKKIAFRQEFINQHTTGNLTTEVEKIQDVIFPKTHNLF